jgi:Aldehyde dehydrogenase family
VELSYVIELDGALALLRAGAARWTHLPVRDKIDLLDACRRNAAAYAAEWTSQAAHAKGVAGTSWQGEEALTGPWAVLAALNALLKTLREIERFGSPRLQSHRIGRSSGGRITVDVFPEERFDRVLLRGVRAEVWLRPGTTPAYGLRDCGPRVALILGAGNVTSIAALDMLSKLVSGNAACIVKIHPLLAYLQPLLEQIFAPLVAGGYLRFTAGGAGIGRYLASHSLVDEIHITGSSATYDALCAEISNSKTITSELGNVTPTIVVPGRWSAGDLAAQAEHIVSTKLHNAGFNCVALQVLIVPEAWSQRDALLESIREVLRAAPERVERRCIFAPAGTVGFLSTCEFDRMA